MKNYSYTGLLEPFLPEIEELCKRGWNAREIANALRGEALREKKPPNWIDPTETTVYHVILSLDLGLYYRGEEVRPVPWDQL